MTVEWSVLHVGIGRLRYPSERDALLAAGNRGQVQFRFGRDGEWRDVYPAGQQPVAVAR